MADDKLTAKLGDAREAIAAMPREFGVLPLNEARASFAAGALWGIAEQLLAGVEAALNHHERVNLYGNAATEDEPGNCPHHTDSDLHFEDGDGSGEWLCEGRPEGAVCSSCVDGEGGERVDWPCPEYQAILTALTGKAADRG